MQLIRRLRRHLPFQGKVKTAPYKAPVNAVL